MYACVYYLETYLILTNLVSYLTWYWSLKNKYIFYLLFICSVYY